MKKEWKMFLKGHMLDYDPTWNDTWWASRPVSAGIGSAPLQPSK